MSFDGTDLSHSVLIGGTRDEQALSVALDQYDQPFLCGYTESASFPITDSTAFDVVNPSKDAFVLQLRKELNGVLFSSFLGGDQRDIAEDIALDTAGRAAVVGWTASAADFPLGNAMQSTFGGGTDAFVAVVDPSACCIGLAGNVNYDPNDNTDLADVTYLTNALFLGGPPPPCWPEANVNGDANNNIDLPDVIYLTNYLFQGGPAPAVCP
jgi:hypothetical protein